MKRPWWMLRSASSNESRVLGASDGESVLVTTRRDSDGDAVEQVWVAPDAVADWSDTVWKDDWK